VIYETGIQIFAERHDRILGFEGVELLKAVAAAWDETRFLDGHPGSHALLARRKGRSWFLGGITDAARTAEIPLGFLPEGISFQAEIYRDGETASPLVKQTRTVTRKDRLSIPMRQAGGFAVYLKAPELSGPGSGAGTPPTPRR
jgi:alpha-glucosidase